MSKQHESISMHAATPNEIETSLISPDVSMAVLTWIVFFLLLGVLYKFAWKPILKLLDERENSIKKSLEDVDKIKSEMEHLDEKCIKLIEEAKEKAAILIDQSRKAAREAADVITKKAKEEAQISLENALRDIREETQKAQMQLREESAKIAVDLAGKLIEENMDTEKNRKLIGNYIKEI